MSFVEVVWVPVFVGFVCGLVCASGIVLYRKFVEVFFWSDGKKGL